ncbi:MAG: peroxiredoxin-like family protein [Bacteroidetes bacterium]|nr:peroxiredoxin-like family protein [Bacteroidota bacterium]
MSRFKTLILFLFIANSSFGQEIPEFATDISPLLIGEQAPDRILKSIDGNDIALREVLADKPTVLIFYRGGWCPYCNVHMAELQDIESDVLALGYQIIGVSPDSPEKLNSSLEKHGLSYLLFSDSDMETALAFGIGYRAPERNVQRLSDYSAGKNPGLLPVPAVFVINTEGVILFEYINPNYRIRMNGDLLMAVLKAIVE